MLGGSAVFFSYSASFFTAVRLAGVIGEDWPPQHLKMLQDRGIDTAGLQVIPGGKTFRWSGRYLTNMNDRETLSLNLNVMAQFDPVLPEHYRRCKFLFLANGATEINCGSSINVRPRELVVADTMDHWILNDRENVLKMLKRINGLVLNDSEAKLLTGDENLVRAGRSVLRWARGLWSSRRANTGPCSSASRRRTSCRPSRLSRWSIPPGPATALPAA